MEKMFSKIPREAIYDETGVQPTPDSTLFQLGVEKSRRLSKAERLLPVADGFNYLLSGQAKIEASIASTTQLFNPLLRTWSNRLMETLRLPSHFLPPVVPSGTVLGPLREEVAKETKLEDVNVVSSCSHAMASAIVGIPAEAGTQWAYLHPGTWSLMGVELPEPIMNVTTRGLNFTNEAGFGNTFRFTKPTVGLWIVENCHHYWADHEQGAEWDVMIHLAASSPPFESLINPMDARFQTPEDMPLKVRAFCRESGQTVPRKPGPIIRCVLESIALYYRKTMKEFEDVTGRRIERLYLLSGGYKDNLLNCFIANALQVPVVIVPPEAAAMGNILVQAIALGHVQSLDEARGIVRESCRLETIQPHAAVWNAAFDRLKRLT
jgi:rhamnulokinase